ncbi:MAG: type IV pilus twitching motility protein PilT [Pyrinomonadaceae bacterium]
MDTLNHYLKTLLSSCSDELRLEPDKNPYLVAQDRTTDLAQVPLMGTQISTMVFPLIPQHVKAVLPHDSEIEFVHPHNLGNFNFTVQKSPAGFIVTIRPLLNDMSNGASQPLPDEAPVFATEPTSSPVPEPASAYAPPPAMATPDLAPTPIVEPAPSVSFELESSASAYDLQSTVPAPTASIDDLLFEDRSSAVEYVPASDETPEIEIVSVNDPEYQTVFSDTATYEPSGRRDDLPVGEYVPPASPAETMQAMQGAYDYEQQPEQGDEPAPARSVDVPARVEERTGKNMNYLFKKMAELGASDLHLSVSVPPMVRKDGKMALLESDEMTLTPETISNLLRSIMPARNLEEFAARHDTDFAYEIPGLARFRCNVFQDRKGMGGVFRIIPSKILTAEELGLSKAIMDLCSLSKGLVVVTGPTGSGKSTTLCAMVDSINKSREDHIITIEDPIEFTHENQKCLVNQREVHNHTDSFKDALRAALREDPDIVLVGEMRDLETISIAIETAETGHLVFGTLHTTTAPSTIDRIIDQFPADRQQQIRVMLSESLKGVIAQTLLPKKGGGRVAALEVLIITPAISNLIREGKTFQIPSAMQTGRNHGMVMLNDALFEHVQNGTVEPMDAYIKAVDKTNFETMLTRGGFKL